MKAHRKQLSISLGKGAAITDEQKTKIGAFALETIPEDQLYVRKVRLAHNAIDRDNERFSEALLDDFARTLPGKSLLIGHRWGDPGKGLFFDAAIEGMDIQAARAATGENLKLPPGVNQVKFLNAWFYTVKTPGKEELLADIDAGITRHASIGFKASAVNMITDETAGTSFWEYKAPGEALEGSLVWLGAQPGAMVTKQAGAATDGPDHIEKTNHKEERPMKKLLEMLGLGADADETAACKALSTLSGKVAALEDEVKTLIPLAEDGKAFRKEMVSEQVKYERLTGRLNDTAESIAAREKQLGGRAIDEVKADVTHLKKLAAEKFPSKSTITGDGQDGRRDNSEAGEKTLSFRRKAAQA